jgi:nicotinamidase-related amidase
MPADTPEAIAPVIVIDLQTEMFSGENFPAIDGADGLLERAKAVIDWARASGRKVAFVRHDGPADDSLAPGRPGWPVWPALGQAADEPTFSKSVGDAFSEPALGEWVADQGAGEVILLGAQTDFCVAATVKGALERGLKVTVVSDAHGTWGSDGKTAAEIIAEHNRTFDEAGARLATTSALTGG